MTLPAVGTAVPAAALRLHHAASFRAAAAFSGTTAVAGTTAVVGTASVTGTDAAVTGNPSAKQIQMNVRGIPPRGPEPV